MKKSKKQLLKKRQILKKNVAMVHVSAKLSLIQRKLVNALLFNAYNQLLQSETHSINVALLSEMIGYDSKDVGHLKEALTGLVQTSVEWDVLDEKEGEVWEVSSLLSHAKISRGVCSYRYDKSLAEKLYHPDVFAQINMSVMKNIQSNYAFIIYENCNRFVGTGETKWIPLEVIHLLMGIEDDSTYKQFKYFKRDILLPAIKIVNKVTNIFVEMRPPKKEGRYVVALKFTVKPNPQGTLLDINEDDEITETNAYKQLMDFKVSSSLARHWIDDFGEDYILEKIAITKANLESGNIKKSSSGFLAQAIQNDYKSDLPEKNEAKKRVADKRQKEAENSIKLDALTTQLSKTQKAYRNHNADLITSHVATLSEEEQDVAIQSFRETLTGNTIALDRFRKDSWRSIISHSAIVDFWKDRASLSFPDFSEFAKDHGIADLEAHNSRISELEKI
jgi:hypothetical protein